MKNQNKAFFFDRDNTLIKDSGYTYQKKNLKFLSGAKRAIKYLNKKKILVIVITNQSGIARKYFKMKDVKNFHSHMNYELKKNEAHIDDFFVCGCHPLYPTKNNKCKCRKPQNLMLLKAIKKWSLNRSKIIMIGDKQSDKMSAKRSKIKFYYKKKNINLYDQVINILVKKRNLINNRKKNEKFKIGKFKIGTSKDPFIIAEAGVNHNGSITIGKKMIDVAAKAGANAIKFNHLLLMKLF